MIKRKSYIDRIPWIRTLREIQKRHVTVDWDLVGIGRTPTKEEKHAEWVRSSVYLPPYPFLGKFIKGLKYLLLLNLRRQRNEL